jgi:hypothetical protein
MRALGIVLVCFLVLVFGNGCTSDPDTPLGSEFLEDGTIKSQPGEVFQDTAWVASGDTSFTVRAAMFTPSKIELGRKDGIESWPIFRVDFSKAGADTLREVLSASLSLSMTGDTDTLRAVFIELGEPLVESDTLKSITLADTIPDSTLTSVVREMRFFPRTYSFPPQLVQDWIRDDDSHNGIAVVLDDTTTTTRLAFASKENGSSALEPVLRVIFKSGGPSTYRMEVDGTFVRDLAVTPNLLLSDGVSRRVYIPIDLTVFDPRTLVHEAKLVLHLVPDSFLGGDFSVTLYAPETADVGDPDVLTGTAVTAAVLDPGSDVVRFSIRNILSRLISEGKKENALVLRYSSEGTSIRRAEFFTSSAPDSLRPSLTFTYSTAPKFPE